MHIDCVLCRPGCAAREGGRGVCAAINLRCRYYGRFRGGLRRDRAGQAPTRVGMDRGTRPKYCKSQDDFHAREMSSHAGVGLVQGIRRYVHIRTNITRFSRLRVWNEAAGGGIFISSERSNTRRSTKTT